MTSICVMRQLRIMTKRLSLGLDNLGLNLAPPLNIYVNLGKLLNFPMLYVAHVKKKTHNTIST